MYIDVILLSIPPLLSHRALVFLVSSDGPTYLDEQVLICAGIITS